MSIADNIGQKRGGTPSKIVFWIIERPYKIRGLKPGEYKLL